MLKVLLSKQCAPRLVLGVGISLAFSGAVGVAHAGDLRDRVENEARSRSHGLGAERADLGLLRRQPGPGASVTATKLLTRLGVKGTPAAVTSGVLATGDDYALQVFADGTAGVFTRTGKAVPKLVDPENRLPDAQLEQLGQDFIKNTLGDVVALGAGEKLIPLRTRREYHQGQAAGSRDKEAKKLVGSSIVFGRSVDGVHVLGAGSKIAIDFDNDGKAKSFVFDWPVLSFTGERQKVLKVNQILERASAHGTQGRDGTATLRRFECGYYDRGAKHHDPEAVLQSACTVQYTSEKVADAVRNARDPKDGLVSTAEIDLIPAGETIKPDKKWPLARHLCTGGDICGSSDVTPILPIKRQ